MEEQLPSGILLFFVLALFFAAAFVFFSGGGGVTRLSVVLGIAFVVLGGIFVWLVGYGGGGQEARLPEATARAGPESTVEATAEETTSESERTDQARSMSYEAYCVQRQFAEATQYMDQQQAIDYDSGVISEAVARGLDPRTILTERGFYC